LSLRVK